MEKGGIMQTPKLLTKTLAASLKATAQWKSLTPLARKDFILWIESAKQLDTHEHRIKRTCEMLEEGKRRPCCFSIVPPELYKQFKTSPKLKAEWNKLSSDGKREFVYKMVKNC